MTLRIPALLYFISYIWLVLCGPVSKHVIEFNDNNIEETLARSEYSFIYFYSNTCTFCAQFELEFEYLSVLYNNLTIEHDCLQVLKTNARQNKRLRLLFSVNQFPTLKLVNFQTKEIMSYRDDRDLGSLIDFIREKTHIGPNYDNFQSDVHYLHDDCESFIQSSLKDTLVVFTVPHIQDWEDYKYPSHFYQTLTLSEYKETVNFVLVDINKLVDNDFLAKYAVSNFPSMVYFTTNGEFKTYNTLSQNTIVNKMLSYDLILNFLVNLPDSNPAYGEWYNNYSDFTMKTNDEMFYSGHIPVRKFGFNSIQGEQSDTVLDIDEEYDILVHDIEL